MARFEKGEIPPVGRQISADVAREMQTKSVESRLRNKRGAELVQALLDRDELDQNVRKEIAASWGVDPDDLKKEVAMHSRQIDKAIRKADTGAYVSVLKAAGYDVSTLNIGGKGINVIVKTKEDAEAVNSILNREQ